MIGLRKNLRDEEKNNEVVIMVELRKKEIIEKMERKDEVGK